ncbi:hypothetical protein BDB01DRAFT_488740 [Pilobolus umbonatus]|nr:hypothetical protein BDB01DRAFT_488740 [Pilobolus umbonatus]
MITKDLNTIEKDIANIDHAMATVAEIRTSIRHFVELVKREEKGPHYVHSFSEHLKTVKRDLSNLAVDNDSLKGTVGIRNRK